MPAVLLVGLGGALGAMARFGFVAMVARFWQNPFPLGILLVNIVGAISMGVVMGFLGRMMPLWQEEVRLFLAVGVLGGFTTFSSFSLDTVNLLERGQVAEAALYVGLSVVVCVIGLYLGLLITRGGTA